MLHVLDAHVLGAAHEDGEGVRALDEVLDLEPLLLGLLAVILGRFDQATEVEEHAPRLAREKGCGLIKVHCHTRRDRAHAFYFRQGYEYWQQLPDSSIALGGFRDHALEQEWTTDTQPTPVIQGLLEQVAPESIVAVVRDPAKAGHLADLGVEVRTAGYDDPDALTEALAGVERLTLRHLARKRERQQTRYAAMLTAKA